MPGIVTAAWESIELPSSRLEEMVINLVCFMAFLSCVNFRLGLVCSIPIERNRPLLLRDNLYTTEKTEPAYWSHCQWSNEHPNHLSNTEAFLGPAGYVAFEGDGR